MRKSYQYKVTFAESLFDMMSGRVKPKGEKI